MQLVLQLKVYMIENSPKSQGVTQFPFIYTEIHLLAFGKKTVFMYGKLGQQNL